LHPFSNFLSTNKHLKGKERRLPINDTTNMAPSRATKQGMQVWKSRWKGGKERGGGLEERKETIGTRHNPLNPIFTYPEDSLGILNTNHEKHTIIPPMKLTIEYSVIS